jgi:hypothetical protein
MFQRTRTQFIPDLQKTARKRDDLMAKVTLLVIRRRVFIMHLLIFLLVMGMLVALNYTLTPAVIWYVYPLIGWGLAVAIHFLFSVVWARESWAETRDEWKRGLFETTEKVALN